MNTPLPADLTLAEELLLLALDPARGRPVGRRRYLRYGLAGAALAELEAAGRVTAGRGGVGGTRAVVVSPLPLGRPLLDAALAWLPDPAKGRSDGVPARRWVRKTGRGVEELCWRALEERGAVRREDRRALGLFPYARHPLGAIDLATPARARFHAGLRTGFADVRSRQLAALVSATDLDARLVPGGPLGRDRRALRKLIRETWTADAVFRAVRQDKQAASGGGGG